MKKIELNDGYTVLIDNEDFDKVGNLKWVAKKIRNTYYAFSRTKTGKHIRMHRFILDINDKQIKIDHKDRNGLNNQRNNLRLATHSQNQANSRSRIHSTSKFLGVHWDSRNKKWKAELQKDNKKIWIGRFEEEREAAKAYNKSAIKYHGQFANLNVL